MQLEDLGLIGNCRFSALVARDGSVVWCCLPRFDSEPVFGALLDEAEGGAFRVAPASGEPGRQSYLGNSNVLQTRFETADGAFRVIDFAPRFFQNDRSFRPTTLVRILEPISGTPVIRVTCEPRRGWSKQVPQRLEGSHHVQFEGFSSPLRLTTDIPLAYLEGRPFALSGRRHLVLAWGQPVEEALPALCDRFLAETLRYWQRWVKHCDVPPWYQEEVIRSALALKLHCYEDTGAIVAAMTTSIPEAPGSGRTWDYRYCWLRDAYYVLAAFRLLGHFEEREEFVNYLVSVAAASPDLDLKPLYRVDGSSDLDESILEAWPGYCGERPVRVGNAAALHRQNDIFGEMVLALSPIFLDERFREERSRETMALIERLTRKAISVAGVPDAGIWEYRTDWKPQTFSSLMCWAAADRMARIAERHRKDDVAEFRAAAERIRSEIVAHAWNGERGLFGSTYGGADADAALLQMAPLRFLKADDERLRRSIDATAEALGDQGWLYRYRTDDGFGVPKVAFVLCTFWLVEALAATGRKSEARELFGRVRETLAQLSPLGLIAEDFATADLRLWGNFPQGYSHVGLIHAAFAASPTWADAV